VAQGFTEREAMNAYQLVTACALGSAVHAIRELRAAEAGRPEQLGLEQVLTTQDLPHLRSLLAEIGVQPLDSFEARITTVLAGIAARRGDDWQDIATKVDRLLTARG
jgi:hypothetical protein